MALAAFVFIAGLILAFLPIKSKTHHAGISMERAAVLIQTYKGPHDRFTTTDGVTLFLWRWNPDTLVDAKKDIAVLIFLITCITIHKTGAKLPGIFAICKKK